MGSTLIVIALSVVAAIAAVLQGGDLAPTDEVAPGSYTPASPTHVELKNFSYSEFDSPDLPGSGYDYMSQDFLTRLDSVRDDLGFPMLVNSGYRTPSHNAMVGGSPTSSHLRGYAADIHCPTLDYLKSLLALYRSHGFTRIGVYKTKRSYFLHVDADPHKNDGVWFVGLHRDSIT